MSSPATRPALCYASVSYHASCAPQRVSFHVTRLIPRYASHSTLRTRSQLRVSFSTHRKSSAMGVSWQTAEQKAFIEDHLPSHHQHSQAGTLKAIFWPELIDEWFKKWPVPEPTPELVQKEGGVGKAKKAERKKKVDVSTTCMLSLSARTHWIFAAIEASLQERYGGQRHGRPAKPPPRGPSCSQTL